MNKNKKKVLFSVLAMLVAAALVLFVFYLISQGKLGSYQSKEQATSEVDTLLKKDLKTKYPETPTEVVKYYWRLNKCIYNNSLSDKEMQELLDQLRILYDDELLAMKENSRDEMMQQMQKDKKKFSDQKQVISTYIVQKNSKVTYNTIDQRECATVITGTLMKVKNKSQRKQIYENFLCRKDSKGKWRILGWKQTTDQKEISSLGD